MPTEFTSVPFPVKALKLVLSELQSDGEPASLSYGGVALKDVQNDRDLEDDDGVSYSYCAVYSLSRGTDPRYQDEEWSDDEGPARPEPSGALSAGEMAYVKEMLGSQEVPQEVFAALGGKGFLARLNPLTLILFCRWSRYCCRSSKHWRFRRRH